MIISGNNNHIVVWENGHSRELSANDNICGFSEIRIEGNDNTLELEFPINAINNRIHILGDNHYCKISSTFKFFDNFISLGCKEASLTIGKNTTIRNSIITLDYQSTIKIGQDCMIAQSDLRGSDCHCVIDLLTNTVINQQKNPLIIGDHVWIAEKCRILKNATIANGSIVGACSVVGSKFDEENCCIVGNPAKIIRRNTTWKRDGYYYYKNKKE